jgi:hypothetical protein
VLGFARLLAHASFPAPVAFTSEGLFLAGMGTAVGAYWVAHHREGTSGKVASVGLGLAAVGCLSMATVLPFIIGPGSLSRPTSTGSSPSCRPAGADLPGGSGDGAGLAQPERRDDRAGHDDPRGSEQGHIHLYLDGSLVTMTGLEASLSVGPGTHTLRAEFVASDHGPFRPPVTAEVTFEVQAR